MAAPGAHGGVDTRFQGTFKSGYGGHVPLFRKHVTDAKDFGAKNPSNALLYKKYFLDIGKQPGSSQVGLKPTSDNIIRKRPVTAMAGSPATPAKVPPREKEVGPGVKVDAWSLQAIPSSRQSYPHPATQKPKALAKIVGYGGHRQGAAFISGETFTQCQLLTNRQDQAATSKGMMTYEPDKSVSKGRHMTYNTHPDDVGVGVNTNLGGRHPGLGGHGTHLLRNSRGPPCVSPSRKARTPFPAYPVMRGPARVRTGGQDVFLTN
eukprot:TRINITY_DN23390_c0_g1_i1.p1 TRINITY_DN23390_c0_g1~~TRINITY_DN23390_c0_g1_i1.p1  ORF type:complete len:263 (+),score=55.85 TRINITY_DN23390_c0_g1_i1:87-875(+)